MRIRWKSRGVGVGCLVGILQGSGCGTVTAEPLEVPQLKGSYSKHVTWVSRGLYRAWEAETITPVPAGAGD